MKFNRHLWNTTVDEAYTAGVLTERKRILRIVIHTEENARNADDWQTVFNCEIIRDHINDAADYTKLNKWSLYPIRCSSCNQYIIFGKYRRGLIWNSEITKFSMNNLCSECVQKYDIEDRIAIRKESNR